MTRPSSRADGYPELEDIDTTYSPHSSGDRVWIQRSRTVIRKSMGWALVAFICDHRWPNYSWHRMVSIRRYRRMFGRWKELSAVNVHADDIAAIAAAVREVADLPIGEPDAIGRALKTGTK